CSITISVCRSILVASIAPVSENGGKPDTNIRLPYLTAGDTGMLWAFRNEDSGSTRTTVRRIRRPLPFNSSPSGNEIAIALSTLLHPNRFHKLATRLLPHARYLQGRSH